MHVFPSISIPRQDLPNTEEVWLLLIIESRSSLDSSTILTKNQLKTLLKKEVTDQVWDDYLFRIDIQDVIVYHRNQAAIAAKRSVAWSIFYNTCTFFVSMMLFAFFFFSNLPAMYNYVVSTVAATAVVFYNGQIAKEKND